MFFFSLVLELNIGNTIFPLPALIVAFVISDLIYISSLELGFLTRLPGQGAQSMRGSVSVYTKATEPISAVSQRTQHTRSGSLQV